MADAIVRLRVESSEYDQKLSRATQQLQHMEKEVRRTGATFAYADKEELAFVQSLGSMETKAESAKGKIAEMTKTFTELSLQYNRLSKEEKNSPFGKGLAQSLEQLKGRIKDSKSELSKVEGSLNGFGDIAKQAAGKLGLPVEQLAKFGPYGAAAAVAIKVAGDAFKQNELIMDEFGRETEEAKGIYTGFLNALNTGDFSSFFSNLDKIRSSARAAYDALDELGTFNAFNQIQTEKARTNFTEATANFREGSGTKEDVQAAADALKKELQTRQEKEQKAYLAAIDNLASTRSVDKDMLERVLQGEYGSYEEIKQLVRLSQQGGGGGRHGRGKSGQQSEGAKKVAALSEMLNKLSDDELQRIQGMGAQAQRTATEVEQIDKQLARIIGGDKSGKQDPVKVPVEPVLPEGSAAALKKQISDLQKQWETATTQGDRDNLKAQIDAANEALKAMTPQVEDVATVIKDAAAMWTEHSAKIDEIKARLAEFQAMMGDTSLSDDQRDWAAGMADSYQKQLDKMQGATEEVVEEIKDNLKEIPSSFEMFKDGVGAVGSLVGSLESLKSVGEDLASVFSGEKDAWESMMTVLQSGIGILETVISITEAMNTLKELGIGLSKTKTAAETTEAATSQASAGTIVAAEGEKTAASLASAGADAAEGSAAAGKAVAGIPIVGPILAVAAIATVLGVVLSAISKSKSAGKYATGGIVPGNSYSGDNMIAHVNSGETILSVAQANNVAAALKGGASQNIVISGKLSGRDILLAANNDNRSRGGQRGFYSEIH